VHRDVVMDADACTVRMTNVAVALMWNEHAYMTKREMAFGSDVGLSGQLTLPLRIRGVSTVARVRKGNIPHVLDAWNDGIINFTPTRMRDEY
jgi:hypothetical protein